MLNLNVGRVTVPNMTATQLVPARWSSAKTIQFLEIYDDGM